MTGLIFSLVRWVEWESALQYGSILYAVTDIVALYMNRRMAASTVVHHYCTAAAMVVVLSSDLRQEGAFKGEEVMYPLMSAFMFTVLATASAWNCLFKTNISFFS